jgi:uncharacterized protein
VPMSDELVASLAGALRACASWHATPDVLVRSSDPPELADALRSTLDDNTVTTMAEKVGDGKA